MVEKDWYRGWPRSQLRVHVVVFTPWLLLLWPGAQASAMDRNNMGNRLLLWSSSFRMCQMCWTTWLHLGRVRFTLFWNKNQRIRIVSRFFFGVKYRTISQHFAGKRCCDSSLYSDNNKILVNVILRRKPSHSYSGIRPIECTLRAVFFLLLLCHWIVLPFRKQKNVPYFINRINLIVFYRYAYAKIYSEIISASGIFLTIVTRGDWLLNVIIEYMYQH